MDPARPAPEPEPPRAERRWRAVAAATVAALGACHAALTLARPYHLDTLLYLAGVRELLDHGRLACALPTRVGNVLVYAPGVALLGEAGLRATQVVVATAAAALYLAAVRRAFGRAVAWASTVTLLLAPATLVTIGHLKEDWNALALVAGALVLASPGAGLARIAGAGLLAGLSLVTKEFAVVLLPFLALHVACGRAAPAAWRELLAPPALRRAGSALLAFAAGCAAAVALLAPGHVGAVLELMRVPTMAGEHRGVSALLSREAWSAWRGAAHALAPLAVLAPVGLAAALVRVQPAGVVWTGSAAVMFVVLGATTVTRDRILGPVLFLVLPPAFAGLAGLARRGAARVPGAPRHLGAAVAVLVAGALAAVNVAAVWPTFAYRRAYPPQAAYFGGLARVLPPDAVLYGMDSCAVASYYTGRPCRTHPVNPAPAEAERFGAELAREAARVPVFLLHDFAAYDEAGALAGSLRARAALAVAYAAAGEDYHGLAWVPGWGPLLEGVGASCAAGAVRLEPLAGGPGPDFERATVPLRCAGSPQQLAVVTFRGHPTALGRLDVVRVWPRL